LIEQKQKGRERVTLFGAVNPIDGEVIVQKAERGNAKTFKKYLKKVLNNYKKRNCKVYMVLDNVRYHHAKLLKPFLEKNIEKLELVFLPAYSPDLNPIERVWWYMRKKISHNRYTKTLNERMIEFWKMFSAYQKPNGFISNLCNINFSV
jgi:transposase